MSLCSAASACSAASCGCGVSEERRKHTATCRPTRSSRIQPARIAARRLVPVALGEEGTPTSSSSWRCCAAEGGWRQSMASGGGLGGAGQLEGLGSSVPPNHSTTLSGPIGRQLGSSGGSHTPFFRPGGRRVRNLATG